VAGLPIGVAELRERWRELPPTLTVEQVLDAGWLQVTRAPLYRAIARHEVPAVKLGRRTLILTLPLLRMLGLEPAVCVTAGQTSGQASGPPTVHDVDGDESP
jgi:hypothetical protein